MPRGIVGVRKDKATFSFFLLVGEKNLESFFSKLLPLANSPCPFPLCPESLRGRGLGFAQIWNPLATRLGPLSGSACQTFCSLSLPRLQIIPCVFPISSFEFSCSCNIEEKSCVVMPEPASPRSLCLTNKIDVCLCSLCSTFLHSPAQAFNRVY